jgi:hypothetical protein
LQRQSLQQRLRQMKHHYHMLQRLLQLLQQLHVYHQQLLLQ